MVKCGDGKFIGRHQDHVRHRQDERALEQRNEMMMFGLKSVHMMKLLRILKTVDENDIAITQPAAVPQSTP